MPFLLYLQFYLQIPCHFETVVVRSGENCGRRRDLTVPMPTGRRPTFAGQFTGHTLRPIILPKPGIPGSATEGCMELSGFLLILGMAAEPGNPAAPKAPASEEVTAAIAEATEAADTFADCAGWWDFMSTWEMKAGRSASAEQFRNMGNGAQAAALWLHAQAYALTATKPARYSAWLPMVAPRRSAAATRAAAMAEHGDIDFARAEGERCRAMLGAQQHAIDDIRRDAVQRELDASTPAE